MLQSDDLLSLTGLELMQAMRDGRLPSAPISQVLKMDVTEAEAGYVVFEGEPALDFYNPHGAVHGGWSAAMLASCMGCAVHTTIENSGGYTTLELKVNYVRAVQSASGRLRAEGRVVHRGRRTATAEGKLVDQDGKLFAHGTTTCLIF